MSRPHPVRRSLLWAVLALLALPAPAMAAEEAPDELVRRVAADVLKIIQQDRELRAGSQSKMAELMEEKIVPNFDFQRMTRLAVGRSWRAGHPGAAEASGRRVPHSAGALLQHGLQRLSGHRN